MFRQVCANCSKFRKDCPNGVMAKGVIWKGLDGGCSRFKDKDIKPVQSLDMFGMVVE